MHARAYIANEMPSLQLEFASTAHRLSCCPRYCAATPKASAVAPTEALHLALEAIQLRNERVEAQVYQPHRSIWAPHGNLHERANSSLKQGAGVWPRSKPRLEQLGLGLGNFSKGELEVSGRGRAAFAANASKDERRDRRCRRAHTNFPRFADKIEGYLAVQAAGSTTSHGIVGYTQRPLDDQRPKHHMNCSGRAAPPKTPYLCDWWASTLAP